MRTAVTLEGFKELDAALADMTKAVAKQVMRRALAKAAEPMAELARGFAPVDSGNLKGSIIVSTKLAGGGAGKQAFGKVMSSGGTRGEAVAAARDANRGQSLVEMYVGPGQHPQGIFQEFGTVNHPPQPFMRPAFDQDALPLIDRLKPLLAAEIDKAAQRAARKAARLAARA
jgi:HK97 gp10 family phage protein